LKLVGLFLSYLALIYHVLQAGLLKLFLYFAPSLSKGIFERCLVNGNACLLFVDCTDFRQYVFTQSLGLTVILVVGSKCYTNDTAG
jgi:hypothetical protein